MPQAVRFLAQQITDRLHVIVVEDHWDGLGRAGFLQKAFAGFFQIERQSFHLLRCGPRRPVFRPAVVVDGFKKVLYDLLVGGLLPIER
jgi:hypothetical protein